MSISAALVGCCSRGRICSWLILIGLASSSRHSSQSTPTSAGLAEQTGHLTSAILTLEGIVAAESGHDAELDLGNVRVTVVPCRRHQVADLEPEPQIRRGLDGNRHASVNEGLGR